MNMHIDSQTDGMMTIRKVKGTANPREREREMRSGQ